MARNSQYQAYLIRFQRKDSQPYWRVTLTNAQTYEVRHFATEQEALRFILARLAEQSPSSFTTADIPTQSSHQNL